VHCTAQELWSVQSIDQYRKCLHRDVASTVQIITVHKIHNSKQLLRLRKVVIDHKQQKADVSRLGAQRMSAGIAFQACGPATESARSPILVRVQGMSAERSILFYIQLVQLAEDLAAPASRQILSTYAHCVVC